MKPAPFDYTVPLTVDDAVSLLADQHTDTKVIAGGQSLIPLLNFRMARPERLVDITRLEELDYVRREDGVLRIGAITRQSAIARSDVVASAVPLLRLAVERIGHVQIRNRGTVGGSVAHADPAAELPVALTALDARFVVRSRSGAREIPAAEMWVTHMTTAMEPDELLCEVVVPVPPEGTRAAFEEFSRRDGDFALAGAAVLVRVCDGACDHAALTLLGAGATPFRAVDAESRLRAGPLDDSALDRVAELAVAPVQPTGDIHGSTAFRRMLLGTMLRRALARVLEPAAT